MSIFYPPEWHAQKSVWFSFPHNSNEWQQLSLDNPLQEIQGFYKQLIAKILDFQNVDLVFHSADLKNNCLDWIISLEKKHFKLETHVIANNDIWIRDYGPFFVFENKTKTVLDFEFNAWGQKFPPWDLDNQMPKKIAEKFAYPRKIFPYVLEGGALEFNGEGVVLTTKQCLLNQNRNPELSELEIEKLLKDSFNLQKVIWLERGLEGDHTDGHIDDFARFIAANKILLCQTDDVANPNYHHLLASKQSLEEQGFELDFLPLPQDMKRAGEYLPASYANFIFINNAIVMPLFNCPQDLIALEVFKKNFPKRTIITIDCQLLIQEGGGLHCMSKQEPELKN